MQYARAFDALIAPTVNCLRRRRPHTFSPTNISWGLEDRSALVRVKGGGRGATSTSSTARPRRSRTRTWSARRCCPAGLRGIEEGSPAPEPATPGVPAEEDPSFEKLPIALEESLRALEQEPATKEFFGEEFVTVYSAMRRYELSRFTDSVTDWERAGVPGAVLSPMAGGSRAASVGAGAAAAKAARRLAAAGVEIVALAMVDNAGVTLVKCVPLHRFEEAVRFGIGLSPVFSVFLVDDSITSSPDLGDRRATRA